MNPYEILKQYGPGYGIPLLLFTSAVGAFVAGRPPIVPRVLAGIAVAWLLSYWVLSYFFLNPPDRPVKTGTGKLGFYVARVEEDPGNKRQKGSMQELHDGIAANRLGSEGVGYLAPAATNDSEEGRALNRRVELVKDKP